MKNLGETGTAEGTNCAISGGGCHVSDPTGSFWPIIHNNHHGRESGHTQIDSAGIKVWMFPTRH